MARTSNPHAATVKAWETRARAASGGTAVQQSGDFAVSSASRGFTKSFTEWFGESRVVDAAGQPRVVYHGTAHPVVFEPTQIKSATGNRGTYSRKNSDIRE